MNQLKEIINNSYSTLPKSQVLQITLDVCYQQMKIVSEQTQNLSAENSNVVLNLQKIDLYSKINIGLLEFLNETKNIEKINEAKNSINILNKLIENDTLAELENGDSETQENITNNLLVPHYLIDWSLNHL